MVPVEVGVPVNIGYGVAPGPDGKPWVVLQITLGLAAYTLTVPERTARELAELIPRQLSAAADDARRARTGLIVPQNGGPANLSPEQVSRLVGG
jgi:hypothetical protein